MTRWRFWGVAAAFFGVVTTLSVFVPQPEPERAVAESMIGESQRVSPTPPVFRNGNLGVLFFETARYQGPIRGAVAVDGDLITQVIIFQSREGHDGAAFSNSQFANSFQGLAAVPPVVVDVVSGATISSRAVIDSVNERLVYWNQLRKH